VCQCLVPTEVCLSLKSLYVFQYIYEQVGKKTATINVSIIMHITTLCIARIWVVSKNVHTTNRSVSRYGVSVMLPKHALYSLFGKLGMTECHHVIQLPFL